MTYPREPTPGQPISATWGREVVRCLRAITPLPGPGTTTEQRTNGTMISAKAERTRVAEAAAETADHSCFRLVRTGDEPLTLKYLDEDGVEHDRLVWDRAFADPFYRDGMTIRWVGNSGSTGEEDVTPGATVGNVSDGVMQGTLDYDADYTNEDRPYVALVGNFGADGSFIAEIKYFQKISYIPKPDGDDGSVSAILLYKLSHWGDVVIDFRDMPCYQHVEIV